jgi:hypothetical protein
MESAHDFGIIFSGTFERVVDVVKVEREAAVLQQTQHITYYVPARHAGVGSLAVRYSSIGQSSFTNTSSTARSDAAGSVGVGT